MMLLSEKDKTRYTPQPRVNDQSTSKTLNSDNPGRGSGCAARSGYDLQIA
jgi:hypothetical protein